MTTDVDIIGCRLPDEGQAESEVASSLPLYCNPFPFSFLYPLLILYETAHSPRLFSNCSALGLRPCRDPGIVDAIHTIHCGCSCQLRCCYSIPNGGNDAGLVNAFCRVGSRKEAGRSGTVPGCFATIISASSKVEHVFS